MSNPDLVPFDEADIDALCDEFKKNEYGLSNKEQARAWNVVFGGKPRPRRTHAVTYKDVILAASFDMGNGGAIGFQDLLNRRITQAEWRFIQDGSPEVMAGKINERFGLTPAPETADEKWERIRCKGLSDEESASIALRLVRSPRDLNGAEVQSVFNEYFGIGEAGA